jgi:hypothetical protein
VFYATRVRAFGAWDRIRSVAAGEDRQREAFKGSRSHPSALLLRGAALAAELLEEAVASGSGDPLRLEVVRCLARDLAEELESLSVLPADEMIAIEGALKTADVANLAACSVPELLEAGAPRAAAAAYLAASAVRALCALAETSIGEADGEHAQNVLRDARGAVWRAQLAVRQVDELLERG